MRAVDIIAKKRDGRELTSEELKFLVEGYTRGDIPDYQVSAWCMAVFFPGMTEAEVTALTLHMAHSGDTLDLHGIAPFVVDKHSTGGVDALSSVFEHPALKNRPELEKLKKVGKTRRLT